MAKIIHKKRLPRRTQKLIREEQELWAQLMDATPELPEGWFPDVPGMESTSCRGNDDAGTPDRSGPPIPGDDAEQEGDSGSAEQGAAGEDGADGAEEAEGDGGDEQAEQPDAAGVDEPEAGAQEAPVPEPIKLTPRGTTFRPADSQDFGSIFSHFTKSTPSGGRLYRREFSSVQDFISQPFANPANLDVFRKEMLDADTRTWRSWKRGSLRSLTRKTDLEWYGAESGDLAADRAIHGWPEGAERVRKLLGDIEAPQPVSVKRKLRRGDQGDELDIHAVYRGALDRAWTRRQRTSHRARMTVRLVVQLGGSQMMNQEEMFWRGAAIAKLTELLEDAGYGVELMCYQAEHLGGHADESHQIFCLKDAGTPLNLEQVVGVVCNAGFFRTWGFRGTYAITGHDLKVDTSDTLLGNSYCYHLNSLEHPEYRLGADGTPTFEVPSSISDTEEAKVFINETLVAVAAGTQEAA